MHGNWQQVSSSTILNSTREVLHNRLSNETVPGTKLLFALASVADKLSPVLSNTVSAFYKAGKHDSVADHNAMAQQPAKAEYFTQQLHKVYHGLANTCKVSSDAAQPSNMPEQPTGHGHTQAGEGTSDCQHAVATSQHAQHQQQDAQRQPEQQQQQHLHNRRGGDEGQSQHQQPNQAGITSDEATTQVELAQVDTCSSAKVQPRVPAAVATEGNDAAAPHQTNHADKVQP